MREREREEKRERGQKWEVQGDREEGRDCIAHPIMLRANWLGSTAPADG